MPLSSLSKLSPSGNTAERMPVLFLGHGSPMNAIVENIFVRGFREAGYTISKPRAILCISAHWETRGTLVTAMEKPRTIHDFGGFPQRLFEVQYPAPGSPDLAAQVQKMITGTVVSPDFSWGLDHGTWSVLIHMFPKSDIPVVQLSLDYSKEPEYHYKLAKELSVFRDKGVLIVGSGNMVHNLSLVDWRRLNEENFGFDWALEAGSRMKELILEGDHVALTRYRLLGKAFELAIPTPEHYLPLLYVLALQGKDENISFFNDLAVGGSLTMTSLKVG